MPNGGSDNCGTCWFNRANGGQAGSRNHDHNIPSYCEIRQLDIPSPFYTYCANHPYRRDPADPIPIGPVSVYRGITSTIIQQGEKITAIGDTRIFWRASPDTEEIREHLIALLANVYAHHAHDADPPAPQIGTPSVATASGWQPTGEPSIEYPIGSSLANTVIAQLAEFAEPRAIPYLEWLSEHLQDQQGADTADALNHIRDRLEQPPDS